MSDDASSSRSVAARLAELQARVAQAAARSGRAPDAVGLIGVAKRIPPPLVVDALRAGLQHVGENYLQEALERKARVEQVLNDSPPAPATRWHFIGQLQSNKARAVVEHFDLLHTLDRASLGRALERHAAEAGRRLDVLLQVNQSGETHKGGLAPDAVEGFLAQCEGWPHLRVTGLMSIPAPSDDPEEVRPVFAALRALRDELARPGLVELSMGMSGDFEVAIEEGATLVRVGTALFGPRPSSPAAQTQQEA